MSNDTIQELCTHLTSGNDAKVVELWGFTRGCIVGLLPLICGVSISGAKSFKICSQSCFLICS